MLLSDRLTEQLPDRLRQLVDARWHPRGDVEDPAPDAVGIRRAQVRRDDVVDASKIVTGSPAEIAVMNSGTTAAYCDVGSWRGPKTLK
jgi:hypothetical protein